MFFFTLIFLLLCLISYKILLKDHYTNIKHNENIINITISGYAKIIDGDSLIIDNHEIRIKEIDAPEYFQKCFDANDQQYDCGKKSKQFLKTLTKNQIIKCRSFAKDIYKRYIASCFLSDKDIAISMLESGWAVIYKNPSVLFKYQEIAKLNKKGMWQGKFTHPRAWRKLNHKRN